MVYDTLLAAAVHQQGRGWRTSRGALAIWSPGAGLIICQMCGHGGALFVDPIEESIRQSAAQGFTTRAFFDIEHLATYDSELRLRLTAFFRSQRDVVAELHVLAGSKIVAMGVSVASLALGNLVVAHRSRDEFTQTLEAKLAQAEVRGFSTGVLRVERPSRFG